MTVETTAAVLTRHGGPEALEIRTDWQVREPGPGEVLVEVRAAGVNNTDVWTRQGAYGLPDDPDAEAGWKGKMQFPRVQGADVAGVAVAAGDATGAALVGRRVLLDPATFESAAADAPLVAVLGSEYDGGFAGYTVAPLGQVHDVHESPLTDEELACLPIAYGTALGMLERAGIGAGETVLVTGSSGGVGVALTQVAAARGARVIAVTTSAKAAAVRDLGAHEVVLRDAADLAGQVVALAPGGLDAVADVAGGPAMTGLLGLLRDGGRWVVAGAVAGPVISLDLRRLYLHNLRLIGSTMHTREHFASLVELARTGDVRPPIAARFPLTEIHRAQERFAQGDHVGKIVLLP